MKKIVFLYALIASFSIVLSDNLSVTNDKPLDGINNPNNNLDVKIENSPVDVVDDKNTVPNGNDIPTVSDVSDKKDENPIDIPKESKTTLPTTTTSTKPTTTTKVPDTTTTSTTPKTTTTKTTTTAAPNTTTTTTTVAPTPTPTPKPTPFPKPSIGFWNSTCIMIQMAGQLNFTYETKDSKNVTVLYNIPKDAKIHDSACDNVNSQSIDIIWGPDSEINSLALIFLKNGSNFYLYTMRIEIQIIGDDFPNAKENQTIHLVHFGNSFKTPIKMSYHCTRMQSFNLTRTVNDTTSVGTIEISNMQIEAFRTDGHSKFSSAKDCDATDTPDIVPIAVGIALIVLILVVLLSYLVARRRSTARGYMSF